MYEKVRDRGHKIVAKNHHFFEFVQYPCNTTFLYQNLMGNPPKKQEQKCKFPIILAATHFFCDHV